VLCPTVGVQATCAQRAYRMLAARLAEAGWLVVRFDLGGTGNSAGRLEEERVVRGWAADVGAAMEVAQASGATRVSLVGMRLGATLAAVAAAERGHVPSLVLWDPCEDGRTFVREQKALRAAAIEELPLSDEAGGVEILGAMLPAQLVADLEQLRIAADADLADRTLVLVRTGRSRTRRRLDSLSGEVEWAEAEGQAELVDVLPRDAIVPEVTLERIVAWLEGTPKSPFRVETAGSSEAAVLDVGDALVTERPVRMGPQNLFGVVGEPLGAPAGPPVVFLNAGQIDHVGPARLWVEMAREFAARGRPTLRFDLSGLGESPPPANRPGAVSYPPEALTDIAVALRSLASLGPGGVTLIGLCSGAYHAIEAAVTLDDAGLEISRVVAVNPVLHFDTPPAWSEAGYGEEQQTAQPFRPWIQWLRRFDTLARLGERWVPAGLWWVLDRSGLQPHPARGFATLAERQVPTLLVCGDVEASHFQRRAKWALRRARRSGFLRFEVMPQADHTLFGAAARARADALVRRWVLGDQQVVRTTGPGELKLGAG